MALSTVTGGSATVDSSTIIDVRDNVISVLKSLSGELKDENGSFQSKQIFSDCDRVDNIKVTSQGSSVSTLEGLVDVIVDKVYKKLLEDMELVFKDRIDNHSTQIDSMITALDTFAVAMNAVATPINGTAIGAAMTIATTTMKVPQTARSTIEATEATKGTHFE